MAKKRLKYACEFCRKRFPTLEAKWGHAPHCHKRKLSLDPATQAKPEAPFSTFEHRDSRRPGPDGKESRMLLLETAELIQQLHRDALDFAGMAYLLAIGNVAGEYEKAKEWLQLSQALDDVDRNFDQMVGRLRLDRSLLFQIYHQMGPLRDTWMYYRTRHLKPSLDGEKEQEIPKDIREEEEMWATVMTNVKKMLAASR